MTEKEFMQKLTDKAFYTQKTGDKGFLGFLGGGYKKYLATTDREVHEQIMLAEFSHREDDDTHLWAIYAAPRNETGCAEVEGIKAKMQEEGLLSDEVVGQLRFEGRDVHGFQPLPGIEDEDIVIRKFSTENVEVYTIGDIDGKMDMSSLNRVILCHNPNFGDKTCIVPFALDWLK